MKLKKLQLNWGTTVALLVSFAALITTIYEANILKSQQRALVWPYFEVFPNYTSAGYSVVARNLGTGPAIITSVETKYDGEPVGSFMDIIDKLDPDSTISRYSFNYRSLNNTVLKAGEERIVFLMPWSTTTRKMIQKAKPLTFKVEYKSVLDEYWVYDFETKTHQEGRFKSSLEFYTSR
ncbi:MAG: hypothetical protein AAF616_03095 [Bacteroidota bacterium]